MIVPNGDHRSWRAVLGIRREYQCRRGWLSTHGGASLVGEVPVLGFGHGQDLRCGVVFPAVGGCVGFAEVVVQGDWVALLVCDVASFG